VQQTLEAFGYAGDNPVNENDPNGMTGGAVGTAAEAQNAKYYARGGVDFLSDIARIGDRFGKWALNHAGTISMVLSVLSVMAFLACPETGVACLAAAVLTKVGTGLDFVSAFRTCVHEGVDANCRLATASVALDVLSSVGGNKVLSEWREAITPENLAKNASKYISRQTQVVGATLSALSAAASVAAEPK
jgi:hypothetical protein